MTIFENDDIVFEIFNKLNVKDLMNCKQVNKTSYNVLKIDKFAKVLDLNIYAIKIQNRVRRFLTKERFIYELDTYQTIDSLTRYVQENIDNVPFEYREKFGSFYYILDSLYQIYLLIGEEYNDDDFIETVTDEQVYVFFTSYFSKCW